MQEEEIGLNVCVYVRHGVERNLFIVERIGLAIKNRPMLSIKVCRVGATSRLINNVPWP